MLDKLLENPTTVGAGFVCLLGFLLVLAGLLFKDSGVKDAGMTLAAGGAAYLGFVARSNAASRKRAAELGSEIQGVKGQAVRDAEDAAVKVVEEKAAIRK
jgi:threonine/homoserine/homoserine lactone efflux protein